MIYLPLDKMTEQRTRALTLDEQRQVPATAPAPRTSPETASVSTVEAQRERGAR